MFESELTLIDRMAQAIFGALTGAAYGVIMWLIAFYITEASQPSIIAWSAIVFGFLGMLFGNLIVKAILALIHFIWGVFNGFGGGIGSLENETLSYLHSFFLVGFGTGLTLFIWWLN